MKASHMTVLFLVAYVAIINTLAFIAYGIDKFKAKKGKWRIPESTLLLLAIIGGSIGAWFGIKVWHHKTLHKKFKYGIPLIVIAQIAIAVYIFRENIQAYIYQ